LQDSECYASAPYCLAEDPFSVAGRRCSPNPSSYYFDEQGELRAELQAEHADYVARMTRLSEARVAVGLPPFPALP
jgi:hypothetical protein